MSRTIVVQKYGGTSVATAAHIRRVLKSVNGHRANAAQTLGISRKNLWEKMKEYGIE